MQRPPDPTDAPDAPACAGDAGSSLRVQVVDGRLRLDAGTHAHVLGDAPAVALLARDGHWWLIPLLAGAGGLQVKRRNARGDRAIEIRDFLREQGVDDAAADFEAELHADAAQGRWRLRRL